MKVKLVFSWGNTKSRRTDATCFERQHRGGEMLRAAGGCTSVVAHRDAFSSTRSQRLRAGSRLVRVCMGMRLKVASGHHFPFHYPYDIKCF